MVLLPARDLRAAGRRPSCEAQVLTREAAGETKPAGRLLQHRQQLQPETENVLKVAPLPLHLQSCGELESGPMSQCDSSSLTLQPNPKQRGCS